MCACQRAKSTLDDFDHVLRGDRRASAEGHHPADNGEQILDPMVHFPEDEALLFLGFPAMADIREDYANPAVGFIIDAECEQIEHAPLGDEFAFESDSLASANDSVIGVEPFLRLPRKRLPDGLANDIADTRLGDESWICGQMAKIA